jgi:ornithine--oxo-acid transaminase
MGFDLADLLRRHGAEKFHLHEQYLNGPFVKVLKTIGFDRHYVAGRGAHLFDADGERYLDLLSGWGVFALGRGHPMVRDALRQVLEAELPNLVQMDVSVLSGIVAERLARLIPGAQKLFFCSSGAEAVEAAIKLARGATQRPRILFCEHGFHGLTYGALSVTGDALFREGFGPLLPGCEAIPFNDLGALEAALDGDDVAAFIVEPIQGKGVNLPEPGYLAEAARLCREHGTLFVADEVQTGVGRTGRFVALEHFGVEPDMTLLAKALSGGYIPIGAVAMRRRIFDRVFDRMDRSVVHGSTFSKNDLAMAAALATLTAIEEEGLLPRAAAMGEAIRADLVALQEKYTVVSEVRGLGLMIGIEFRAPAGLRSKAAWSMLGRVDKGLFCQTVTIPLFKRHRVISQVAGHGLPVVKLLPPLVLEESDRIWIRDAFDDVLADCENLTGAVWDLVRNLASHAARSKLGVG